MLAVIGDIHGCFKSFRELVHRVTDKYFIHRFIILGDFVDRGPCSREVTDYILELEDKYLVTVLRGNHEDMLIDYINQEGRYPNFKWRERVGRSAVASFAGRPVSETEGMSLEEIRPFFEKYMTFFKNAKKYMVEEAGVVKFLFTHAGIGFPDKSLENQEESCSPQEKAVWHPFIWSRAVMKLDKPFFDYIIVHGHTPVYSKDRRGEPPYPIERRSKKGRLISVNLDTGCCYGGALSAMIVDNTGRYDFETVPCAD